MVVSEKKEIQFGRRLTRISPDFTVVRCSGLSATTVKLSIVKRRLTFHLQQESDL